HEPVSSQFALNSEVPLLRRACNPMQGHGELDQAIHVATERWGARLRSRKGAGCGESLQDRSRGHISLRGPCTEWRNAIRERRARRKQVGQAVGSGIEAHEKWESRRNNGEIVNRPQVFADAVNAIPAANRGGVAAAYIIGKT